jgi:hypothetical protein
LPTNETCIGGKAISFSQNGKLKNEKKAAVKKDGEGSSWSLKPSRVSCFLHA